MNTDDGRKLIQPIIYANHRTRAYWMDLLFNIHVGEQKIKIYLSYLFLIIFTYDSL